MSRHEIPWYISIYHFTIHNSQGRKMSIGKSGLGIPAVLLHDAEGFLVTVETKSGEMYRGLLTER